MNRIAPFILLVILMTSFRSAIAQTIGGHLSLTKAQVTNINNNSDLTVSDASGFSPGDRILIIQMQGATVDLTNTDNFGTILNPDGSTGLFEIATVCEVVGTTITTDQLLVNAFAASAKIQVIHIPQYNNLVINSELTTDAWDGNTGGVLVLEANTIDLNANINMAGKGFRGGTFTTGDGSYTCTGIPFGTGLSANVFFNGDGDRGGAKGEGIGNYPIDTYRGRSALANGGGGGNDHNTGGGGGSNISQGGRGGENGSTGFNFDCKGTFEGEPGFGLNATDRLYMGGGGGAGHGNNNQGSSGANGGGIIILKANVINGAGFTINVDGADAEATTDQVNQAGEDGAGGGGAGGSIYLDVLASGGTINLSLNGGDGGDAAHIGNQNDCFGPGGGGSGGMVKFRGTAQSAFQISFSGGTNGVNSVVPGSNGNNPTSCLGSAVGATPGTGGQQFIEQGAIPEGTVDNIACNISLPIELMTFEATPVGQAALLTWTTAIEENSSHFDVQRSADGRAFESIARIEGQGFSSTSVHYEFLDEKPAQPWSYYRLMLVDLDGSTTFSEVKALRFTVLGIQELTLFPNPVRQSGELGLQIETDASMNAQVRWFNTTGQLLLSTDLGLVSGKQQLRIPLPQGQEGMYFVEIQTEQQMIRRKVMILD
ncbi:MAG: T9SS type A sorting domain-containing protein [Bacteroidota bacterium]